MIFSVQNENKDCRKHLLTAGASLELPSFHADKLNDELVDSYFLLLSNHFMSYNMWS
jgi:hypothetical protein